MNNNEKLERLQGVYYKISDLEIERKKINHELKDLKKEMNDILEDKKNDAQLELKTVKKVKVKVNLPPTPVVPSQEVKK